MSKVNVSIISQALEFGVKHEKESFWGYHKGKRYRVDKNIVITKLFDPIKSEILTYRYNIGRVHPIFIVSDGNPQRHGLHYSDPILEQPENKATFKEVKKFCPDPDAQNVYFFNCVLSESGAELPLYEGILYYGDCDAISSHDGNAKNRAGFIDAVQNIFKDLVFNENIHQSFARDNFRYLHDLGDSITEFLYRLSNPNYYDAVDFHHENGKCKYYSSHDYALEFLQSEIQMQNKLLSELKDPALRCYMQNVILSFYKDVQDKKIVTLCPSCNKLFSYKRGKKYCSPKCLKSSANQRNYKRRQETKR